MSLGQLPPEIFFDNQYLNTLVTLGAIGLLATAWFVWGAASKTVRAARRATGREASLLAACGLAASGFAFGLLFFDAFAFVQAKLVFVAVAALGLRVAAALAIPADERKGREASRRSAWPFPQPEPLGEARACPDRRHPRGRRLGAGGSRRSSCVGDRDPYRGWAPAGNGDGPLGRDGRLWQPGGEPQVIEIPRETYTSETIPSGGTLEHVFEGRAGPYIIRQVGSQVHQGRVVVEVEGEVSLTADETVPFGKRLTLRGTSTVPGSPRSRSSGASRTRGGAWQEIATAEVADDGTFLARLELAKGGRFRAEAAAGQVRSAPIRVDVQPRVTMKIADASVPVGGLLRVTGKVTPADSARRAVLEVYDRAHKRWQRVDSARVAGSGAVTLVYRLEEPGGMLVRVGLQRSTLAAGFALSTSAPGAVRAT